MYRVIKAASETPLDDKAVLNLIGRANYDQMYKACCRAIDREIFNSYGDVEVSWNNGGFSANDHGDGSYSITGQIYAQFTSDEGNNKDCYGEVRCNYDGTRESLISPEVTYFTDEIEYE